MGTPAEFTALRDADQLLGELQGGQHTKSPNHVLTEAEAAYMAGILDGEGTFTVYRTGLSYNALAAVASTTPELLDWIVLRFKGSVSELPATGNREVNFQWQCRYKPDLVRLIEQVSPYLLLKKLHAMLLRKYCLELDNPRGRQLSEEIKTLRDAYCVLFADLNSRGVGANERKNKVIELFKTGEVALL